MPSISTTFINSTYFLKIYKFPFVFIQFTFFRLIFVSCFPYFFYHDLCIMIYTYWTPLGRTLEARGWNEESADPTSAPDKSAIVVAHNKTKFNAKPMFYVIYLLTSPPLRAPSVLGHIIIHPAPLSLGFFTRPSAPLRTARSCLCLSAKTLFQRLTTVTYFV